MRASRSRAGPVAIASMPRVLGLLLFTAAFVHARAHDAATGIVKQRMDAMSEMGKAGKSIGAMLAGRRPLDPVAVREMATAIGERASQIPALFPDTEHSRRGNETEALSAIWDRPAEFEALAARLERESAALADAAARGDERLLAERFSSVRETCRVCHDDFREKKDEKRHGSR